MIPLIIAFVKAGSVGDDRRFSKENPIPTFTQIYTVDASLTEPTYNIETIKIHFCFQSWPLGQLF